MITFLRLGTKGNLGNQLFQIASTIGLSAKNDHSFAFPSWKYSKYFVTPPPTLKQDLEFQTITEKQYNVHEWPIGTDNYNLEGWLQSEKYFDVSRTKFHFRFKEEFVLRLRRKFNYLLSDDAILISVRRGDFVNHPRYYQLNYKYYLLAIIHNFPEWKKRKLIFTSDDIGYCQRYFGFLPNSYFINNLSPIKQLILGSQFNNFIISNSTFSWWMAWLGEDQSSKIVRPKRNFRGKYLLENNDKDYFPTRWIVFDHHRYRFPAKYYKLFIKGEFEDLKLDLQFRYQLLKRTMIKMMNI